ncbi:MAG: hypothetical protein GY937_28245 [bacterium]|nr:hypothetical protein [bacterium]
MDRHSLREIVACLPQSRTLFPYFRDRYAFQLLGWMAQDGASVRSLRTGPYGFLLDKASVRQHLARLPDGQVPDGYFGSFWPAETRQFRLSLSGWGHDRQWGRDWYQTSRPGWNLVLRLDLPASHARRYQRLMRPAGWDPFYETLHPVARRPAISLAWVRLDLDLARGQALIEEIQNDWLRRALELDRAVAGLPRAEREAYLHCQFSDATSDTRWQVFRREDLAPLEAIWDEAMLSAALFFLRDELGIGEVWMHSHLSARLLRGGIPPRSLYEKLPRRFGFRRTRALPPWLREHPNRRWRRKLRERPPTLFYTRLA